MHHTDVVTIVVLILLPWGESQVTLERTVPSGMLSVCPNATAVFTCRVMGSNIIGWTSPEYVGQDQVAFTTGSTHGSVMTVINGGAAILTQNSGGILESQLNIHASINASIRCFPANIDNTVTVNVTVYDGVPGVPTGIEAVELPFAESCAILVNWDPPTDTPPEDISHYILHDSMTGVSDGMSIKSTVATFVVEQCTDNLFVSVSAVDRCGREGPSSEYVQLNVLPRLNPVTDATTASGTLNSTTAAATTTTTTTISSASGTSLASVIIATIFFATSLIINIVIIMVLIRIYLSNRHSKVGSYLTINDLDKVKKAVHDAQVKWRIIGQNVGIQGDDLKTISQESGGPESHLTAVLQIFLQQVDPKPTWKRLADALALSNVTHIAEELREKYHLS